jgi:serine/threonine protein kinase
VLNSEFSGKVDADMTKKVLFFFPFFASTTAKTHQSQAQNKLVREGMIWTSLKHPNITPFFGVCYELAYSGAPCFIIPYYPNGDINAYLSKHPNADRLRLVSQLRFPGLYCYPVSSAIQVRQVAAGIKYLHNLKVPIVHGDIKSVGTFRSFMLFQIIDTVQGNILVDDEHVACVTDFGVSRALECSGFTTSGQGSSRWMAPELFDHESPFYNPRITMATDIWAFSMCALEVSLSHCYIEI